MKETTLDTWNRSSTSKRDQNIFQIWKAIGEKVPFAVRNYRWSDQYYTVVEKIEIGKWPYGYAYGYPTINGRYSNHYEHDKTWRKCKQIPLAGCYQWTFVENAIINKDFSVLNTDLPLKKTEERSRIVASKIPGACKFDEIHVNYPKAYAKWSSEDDEKLRDLYLSGKTPAELAPIFQRKLGAIESRLVKLELISKKN